MTSVACVLRDRLEQVSLAKAGRAVDVKGVVVLAGMLRGAARGRGSHPIAIAKDKALKGEPGI